MGSEIKKDRDEGLPTTIVFEHKFFTSLQKMYFRISEQTGDPVLVIKLSTYDATLSFPGIKREFLIADDSRDGRMLALVAEALGFVKVLQVGDPLPREVISTEASWEPSSRHFQVAYNRLTMQMVTWLSGDETVINNPDELMQLAGDPITQRKVRTAFEEAAEKMGIGRDRKQDVIEHIESLAKELAYIEALRERFGSIKEMEKKIQGLRRLYGHERSLLEIADPSARLIQRAIREFQNPFDEVDAQTGEILAVLRNLDAQVKFIRRTRDFLFRRFAAWEDILKEWAPVPITRSAQTQELFRSTYKFLAPRYMQVNEWVLASKLIESTKKKVAMMTW
ncbi:MAG: hypothetical protein HQL37_04970 [Alphaproteobacteria bacterium]|nr:hypothetical protein [Alphaproteobacteria bacterium]